MKKTPVALTLLIIFFVSLGTKILGFAQVVKADPYTSPAPPVYTVYSPKNNTIYSNSSVNFSFKIDPLGDPIVDYDYYYSLDEIRLRHIVPEEILLIDPDRGPLLPFLYFSTAFADLSDGKHNLTLHHQYTNRFIPDLRITVSDVTIIFYVDTEPPKIIDLSVTNADSGDRLLSFTVDEEASWLGYSLDNQANVTVNGDAVLSDLPVGSHNVTVYAEDAQGHVGASETLFFTVDELEEPPEPFPTLLVATISLFIVAGLAVFLLYMRRHKH